MPEPFSPSFSRPSFLLISRCLIVLMVSGVLGACTGKKKDADMPIPVNENLVLHQPFDSSGSYIINLVTGDSIQPIFDKNGVPLETMKPVPTIGAADKLTQQPSKTVPARWIPAQDQPQSYLKRIEPTIIPTSLAFEMLPLVKDTSFRLKSALGMTIPTGTPIVLKGKKTRVNYPQSEKILPPKLHYETGFNLKSIGEDQGALPGGTSGVVEDQYGYKWISYLGGGISRFDGQSFWHFTEKEGLPSNMVWGILKAQDGKLWMNTVNDGVMVFDGNEFTNYSASEGFPGNGVKDLYEDSWGNIWINRKFGISKYDGKAFTHFSTKEGLFSNSSARIFEDKTGAIWMAGISNKTISKYDGTSFTNMKIPHPSSDRYLTPLFEDRKGNLWLTSENEILIYDGNSFMSIPANINEFFIYWQEDTASGDIWIASKSTNIYKYDGEQFWDYSIINGKEDWPISKIEKDKAGNIWIALAGRELYVLNEKSFRNVPGIGGGALVRKDQKIRFISSSGNLSKYEDGRVWELEGSDPKVRYGTVRKDKQNHLWIGLYQGMARFDGQNITYYRDENLSDYFTSRDFWEDHQGNMWIVRNNGVILKYDGKTYQKYDETDGIPPYHFSSILEDKDHNLWFSSEKGLVKFKQETFTIISEKEGLSSNYIISMEEDNSGNLWLGTYGAGLMKFDGSHFTYFTEKNGLCNNIVTSIAADAKGRIWVGTGDGLNLLVPKGNPRSLADNQDSEEYMESPYSIFSFYKKDGLKDDGVGWNNLVFDENKRLWIGINKGVAFLDTDRFTIPSRPESIQIDQISINGNYINFRNDKEQLHFPAKYKEVFPFYNYPQNLILSHHNNHLTFHFSAVDWTAPHKIKYSFRIGGKGEWSLPSIETKADFRNLPPGAHTFEVKAIGQSLKWSEPFVYKFRISPPWWQTWWAFVLYGIGIVVLIYGYNWWRIQKLTKRNQELEGLVEKRTTEIKDKNVQLAESLYHLKQTQQQLIMQEKMASLGQLTMGVAHEIKNPLNFVNNFAEGANEMIEELAQDLDQLKADPDPEKLEFIIDTLAMLQEANEDILANGKRANQIINSMMDHANDNQSEKQKVDINQLIKEQVNLVQMGYQAEIENFQVDIIKDLSLKIPQVSLFPQEFGRVLINLITNALYAMEMKQKDVQTPYQPKLQVHSGFEENRVTISIKDNGAGIPKETLSRIFEPFFTTKPTGKGNTGLGLAICYDIITKGLQGTIEVKSKEGEFTKFMISIPIL